MSEPTPFCHEFTISGLSSMCDRITAHPSIEWHFYETFKICFYPMGFDESCKEYVSFWVYNKLYLKYHLISCKISIKNNKNEKLFVKELIMKMGDKEKIKEYIKREHLLDPSNGLTQNDQFTFCLEGWVYYKENATFQTNLVNDSKLVKHYFDFSPLLSTKSFKWTIENFLDLFESNKLSIELPQFKYLTETDEEIFFPKILIKKDFKKLFFILKSDYKGTFIIETSVIDINQQKCHGKKDASGWFVSDLIHSFSIDEEIYLNQSILTDNRLTLFCEIFLITESIKKESKVYYLQILKCFKVPPALKITECTINGQTGEILQNKTVPLLSNIEYKEIEIVKLKKFENRISEQTSTIDRATFIVNKVYHEHYFENSNIKNSLVNTKSKSIFGNISIKSEKTDCAELIETLEDVVSNAIKPVLNKNEQIYIEIKSSTKDLLAQVFDNNKLLLENHEEMKKEMNALRSELNKMKQTKKVKNSKMKQIVDRIIALLNRIKYQLNRVGTNISQVQKSKSTTPKSKEQTNPAIEYIEPLTSSLIKYIQSIPTSQSISNEIKDSHIHKLEIIKNLLISHLPSENLKNIAHFEVESITLENAGKKLTDIIDNQMSDLDIKYHQKLLIRLRDLFVESKSETSSALADKVDESKNSK